MDCSSHIFRLHKKLDFFNGGKFDGAAKIGKEPDIS